MVWRAAGGPRRRPATAAPPELAQTLCRWTGRGRKRKGTVVQRLARKLLSGRARDAATGEMLEAEMAAQAALHSNRWEER